MQNTGKSATDRDMRLKARLMTIGMEVFPVYGDERSGFSVDPGDVYSPTPYWQRYRSMDELYFALVNLNNSKEGRA